MIYTVSDGIISTYYFLKFLIYDVFLLTLDLLKPCPLIKLRTPTPRHVSAIKND